MRYFFVVCSIIAVSISSGVLYYHLYSNNEKEFVVVIPSYNNNRWYKQNLDSIFVQEYANYRIIYIDDCSTDGTGDLVEEYIKNSGHSRRVHLIKNSTRRGALANLYDAIHSCNDRAIIITIDGDDWLKHAQVFKMLNNVYKDPQVLITFGQFEVYPEGHLGICHELPAAVIRCNAYRKYEWVSSHLRTFYAGLFKRIKKEDLMYEGDFFAVAWDQAFMFPMLEMAAGRYKFISDIVYVYNQANPLNDFKVRLPLLLHCSQVIRNKSLYKSLATDEVHAWA